MELTRKGLLGIVLVASMAGSILADCSSCSSCDSCSTSTTCANGYVTCKPDFLPFSQGENRALDYANVAHLQNLPEQEDWNWHGSLAAQYQQSFNGSRIGVYLFPNGTNKIVVGPANGSGVDVIGLHLGLSPTFQGELTICPKIKNVIITPMVYVGLDRWVEGAWLRLKVPFTHTRWELNCKETSTSPSGDFFVSAGLVSNLGPVAVKVKSIIAAFSGADGNTWGHKTSPLYAGLLKCDCASKETGVADVPLDLGWNFVNKTKGYLGVYGRVVFPTGSYDNRRSLFDARVGYGRWQLGGGLQGRVRLYEKDEESSLNLYADVYVTHLFKKTECRVFDSKDNGCWSRYLLMKEVDSADLYTGILVNFVDKFTACAESRFDWNVDGVAFLDFRHKDWGLSAGYEVKARDCEKLCLNDFCDPANRKCKCDCSSDTDRIGTNKYGFIDVSNPAVAAKGAAAGRTASNATIKTVGTPETTAVVFAKAALLAKLDLVNAAIPRAVSHKVFGNLNYTWSDMDYPVSLGIGGEAEFANDNKALDLWGVWAKVAVAYA